MDFDNPSSGRCSSMAFFFPPVNNFTCSLIYGLVTALTPQPIFLVAILHDPALRLHPFVQVFTICFPEKKRGIISHSLLVPS